MQDTLDITGAG